MLRVINNNKNPEPLVSGHVTYELISLALRLFAVNDTPMSHSKFGIHRNGIWNPFVGIQNPRLVWTFYD